MPSVLGGSDPDPRDAQLSPFLLGLRFGSYFLFAALWVWYSPPVILNVFHVLALVHPKWGYITIYFAVFVAFVIYALGWAYDSIKLPTLTKRWRLPRHPELRRNFEIAGRRGCSWILFWFLWFALVTQAAIIFYLAFDAPNRKRAIEAALVLLASAWATFYMYRNSEQFQTANEILPFFSAVAGLPIIFVEVFI